MKNKKLVEELYKTIYALRRMFMVHPATKDVKTPEQLSDQNNIV